MFTMYRSLCVRSLQRTCCDVKSCGSSLTQQRFLFPSASSPRREKLPDPGPGFKVYYHGNLTPYLKMLKTFSMSTTISGTLIYYYAVAKLGLLDQSSAAAASALSAMFGVMTFSPLLINLITKRYIVRLAFNNDTKVFKIESLNIVNRLKTSSFTADQVTSVVTRPFTTFMIGRKPFFCDPLQFSDISVYEHLMGYDKIKHLVDEPSDPSGQDKDKSNTIEDKKVDNASK